MVNIQKHDLQGHIAFLFKETELLQSIVFHIISIHFETSFLHVFDKEKACFYLPPSLLQRTLERNIIQHNKTRYVILENM